MEDMPQWKGGGGWYRGVGVLVLPPRLLFSLLVNKLWENSMEGMPVKIPSSRPIIDQNNQPRVLALQDFPSSRVPNLVDLQLT